MVDREAISGLLTDVQLHHWNAARPTIPENLQAGHQESAFCFSAAATKVKSTPHH
jgi:hypothetical protein